MERRSLMNNSKRVVDMTEPCGTPLLIDLVAKQCPSTTAEIKRPERTLEIKEQKEGQDPKECSLESKDLCQTLSKAFDMSSVTEKVSANRLREDDQEDHQQNVPCGTYTGDQIEVRKWKGAFESSGKGLI